MYNVCYHNNLSQLQASPMRLGSPLHLATLKFYFFKILYNYFGVLVISHEFKSPNVKTSQN